MEGKYHDLGKNPKKLNDTPSSVDSKRYPCMYDVTVKNFPPLADMKLGSTGEAMIKFKIAGSGGIEVMSMKMMGMSDMKQKEEESNGKDKD